jgi:hypothetical protein
VWLVSSPEAVRVPLAEIAAKFLPEVREQPRAIERPLEQEPEFAHGPVAALDPFFPVWTIASRDAALGAVAEGAARVRQAGRQAGRRAS